MGSVCASRPEDKALAGTLVILLSARAGEESRLEGLQAGADDYLVKPFPARELLAASLQFEIATSTRRSAHGARERLNEVVIRSSLQSFEAATPRRRAREQDNERAGERLILPDGSQQTEPIQLWHHDIGQKQSWSQESCGLQGLPAI